MASLDDGLLYQRLMYVPGLTGTWRDRADQYMRALTGKPYDGSLQTGLYLLDQIKKRNFPQAKPEPKPAPAPKPAPTPAAPQPTLAEQYTKPIVDKAAQIAKIPTFQQALPFYDAWSGIVPQATRAAESQINPEVMRDYNQAYESYMGNLVSKGGQRFGRGFSADNYGGGMAGIGGLKAASERNRQGQLQDWLNQYQQGYKQMFYEPSQQAWEASRTQGIKPDQSLTNVPTWSDLYGKYSSTYGVGDTTSPLYG